ncbi:MAG: riboflavin kinase, partial [bacterium]|nr:riboflavin kinase [bacterium]
PTFFEHAEHSILEAHLLDFDDDLYGHEVQVEFLRFLRSERRFSGIDALAAQLKKDVENARRIVAEID